MGRLYFYVGFGLSQHLEFAAEHEMTFEKDQSIIVHHMDGQGKPLFLEGTVVRQESDTQYWVNVGSVALLVDEKIIKEKK
jgi:hypothetical protein